MRPGPVNLLQQEWKGELWQQGVGLVGQEGEYGSRMTSKRREGIVFFKIGM